MDATEYLFKLALLQRKYDAVINMIKGSALCGQVSDETCSTVKHRPYTQAMT